MKRPILVLATLLILANWAVADFLLIKIDFDQIPFDMLRGGGKATTDKGSPNTGKKGFNDPEPKTAPDSANWVYGIFEFNPKEKEFKHIRPEIQDKDPKNTKLPQGNPFTQPPGKGKGKGKGQPTGGDPKKPFDLNQPGKGTDPKKTNNGPELWRLELDQKAGKKVLPVFLGLTFYEKIDKRKTPAQEFAARKAAEAGDAGRLLNLAQWALQHALYREFREAMALLEKADPGHKAVLRYKLVRAEMDKKPAAEPLLSDAARMELKSLKSQVSDQGHYVIYWKNGLDISPALISQRLVRLENAYQNFFCWCALQEKMPLPVVPKQRLAVLVEPLREFGQRLREQGRAHAQVSGLVARRDNVLVLSSSPNNELCEKLKINLDDVRTSRNPVLTQDQLLSGSVWDKKYNNWFVVDEGMRKERLSPKPDVALLQTLVLMLKSMEDDVELSTISREGTRQLLGASGFLARNVAMPEWLQTGLVNYFEVPPMHLHLGFGQPRSDQLRTFEALTKENKSSKNSDILADLATDQFFRPAKKDAQTRQNQVLGESASWALVYYLASQRKMEYLSRYAQQLNEFPRHMVFHPETLANCFNRSFSVKDVRDKDRLDAGKWLEEMDRRVPSEIEYPEVDAFFEPQEAGQAP